MCECVVSIGYSDDLPGSLCDLWFTHDRSGSEQQQAGLSSEKI